MVVTEFRPRKLRCLGFARRARADHDAVAQGTHVGCQESFDTSPQGESVITAHPPVRIVGGGGGKNKEFPKGFCFLWRLGPLWLGMAPKCGPRDQLLNAEVSSKSGQWRLDWWRKCVLEQYLFLQSPVPWENAVFSKTYFRHQSGRHWPDLDDTLGFESWSFGPHFGPIPGPMGGPTKPFGPPQGPEPA